MTTFERIHSLAKSKKISIKELASILGFGENTIYRWKHQEPKGTDLSKVADYFNVSTDYLLCRTDNPTPGNLQDTKMFFRMNTEGLTEQDKEELEQDLKDFMELRRKRYMDKKNGK
ncbi:helix-turn-helix domain-containing protein [Listeria fleischmannii]|uniref:helix-turn-helix domain-containing protein n=1 Tax=Listeria fleischmannii TaxID=1069827 RepID=UPI001628B93F|nr:helix-turn-helix transcriptional regulator [Listeria fleischmannii]MBC1419925.1 helix-turn-helix transcriptional regulator [Listeria fleischmannii]